MLGGNMNLGTLALAVALVSGALALLTTFVWATGRNDLRGAARLLLSLMALSVGVASVFQMWNILTHQFQYQYVANFSDRSLPTLLLASTFWGGQSGSLLLWSLWSVIFALVLSFGLRHSSWEPYVLTPYLLAVVSVIGITVASTPFKMMLETPADGNGLNPLLQNYWMAIHPPILFTGFTTMAGPFALAIAALWKGDYDGWIRMARPWTILAWTCLGTGLALGGFWAYESLGWGGFWGWDPVENSSLVPWLFASALLHGSILQGARGSFKRGNLFLAIFGYLMVVYSTFLTRSGLWGRVSVHSFVELGLMRYLVAFMAIFVLLGFGLLLWRWRTISGRILYTSVWSREFGLVTSMVLFVMIALIVGIGTSVPVITMVPLFERQAMVDLAFYGPALAPFGLLLLVTMSIGPLLGWQKAKYGSLRTIVKWPALVTTITLFTCLLLNITYPVALLFIAGAVFAAATNAMVIWRIGRAGPLKLGGYLSHVGVGILFVGVVGTGFFKQTASLQLMQDSPQQIFGRQLTFRGLVIPVDDPLQRAAVQIEVTDPQRGQTWFAEAPYYVWEKSGQLVQHPAIQPGPWSDLYIAASQYIPAIQTAPGLVQLVKGEPHELLGYTITFDAFQLPNRDAMVAGKMPAEVRAVVSVKAADGTTTTITPSLRVAADQNLVGDPAPLPDGATVTLRRLAPEQQMIEVQLGGVDLSRVNPDDLKGRVFIEVSREPGIKLVWLGFIIGVLGGLLAGLRRWRESRTPIDPSQTRIPKPTHRHNPARPQPALTSYVSVESETP
jgi:cytochrome c-type biogenesis protein CcmF